MKIPRRIEWRVGVVLVGVAGMFLSLLIVLALVRMDVGVEVEGWVKRGGEGWTLTVELPGERLRLLPRCRFVHVRVDQKHTWYGRIVSFSGQLAQDGSSVRTEIEVEAMGDSGIQTGSSHPVQAMLLEQRRVPVLRVLFDGILPRQRI